MPRRLQQIKVWLPSLAGVCLVFISAGYAWSIKTSAAQEIDRLHELGSSLNSAAQDVRGTLSPDEVKTLEDKQKDLRARMDDATKPGLIQAELLASARKVQLEIREIQPVAAGAKTSGASTANFRVSVTGTYQRIAEYLQLCRSQRLPVRVTALRLIRRTDEKGRPLEKLTADITVEAFQPVEPDKQGA